MLIVNLAEPAEELEPMRGVGVIGNFLAKRGATHAFSHYYSYKYFEGHKQCPIDDDNSKRRSNGRGGLGCSLDIFNVDMDYSIPSFMVGSTTSYDVFLLPAGPRYDNAFSGDNRQR